MISLSLAAVAYMSIVMFVHDDYTTCLKIIKLINCITHVMIILGNNAFFFVCVHICGTHTNAVNKIINLTDVGKYGSATESHNLQSCRVFRGGGVGHRCQIQIQQVSSFKHANKVPWYSSLTMEFSPQAR